MNVEEASGGWRVGRSTFLIGTWRCAFTNAYVEKLQFSALMVAFLSGHLFGKGDMDAKVKLMRPHLD